MGVNFICTPPSQIVFLPDANPCGRLNTPCCRIPDNDLNAGTCSDTTVAQCFDGECVRCGLDGGPACSGTLPRHSRHLGVASAFFELRKQATCCDRGSCIGCCDAVYGRPADVLRPCASMRLHARGMCVREHALWRFSVAARAIAASLVVLRRCAHISAAHALACARNREASHNRQDTSAILKPQLYPSGSTGRVLCRCCALQHDQHRAGPQQLLHL